MYLPPSLTQISSHFGPSLRHTSYFGGRVLFPRSRNYPAFLFFSLEVASIYNTDRLKDSFNANYNHFGFTLTQKLDVFSLYRKNVAVEIRAETWLGAHQRKRQYGVRVFYIIRECESKIEVSYSEGWKMLAARWWRWVRKSDAFSTDQPTFFHQQQRCELRKCFDKRTRNSLGFYNYYYN